MDLACFKVLSCSVKTESSACSEVISSRGMGTAASFEPDRHLGKRGFFEVICCFGILQCATPHFRKHILNMDLQELLAFVDECDVGDAEHHQQQQASTDSTPGALHSSENNGSDSEEKEPRTRPRRDVVEIAALQAQAAALALELQRVKQDRAVAGATSALLLTAASHWVSETDLQSRLRAAAQEENERLRAKMHEQMLIAKRLINVLKRNSASHVR